MSDGDGSILDVASVKARIAGFERAHGDSILHNGWIYFQDGAVRELNPLGLLAEPPEDPWKLAVRIRDYWQLKMAVATEAFDLRKKQFLQSAKSHLHEEHSVGAPPVGADAAAAELNVLKQAVVKAKAGLDAALAECARAEPEGLKRGRERNDVNRQANQELLDRIGGIQL